MVRDHGNKDGRVGFISRIEGWLSTKVEELGHYPWLAVIYLTLFPLVMDRRGPANTGDRRPRIQPELSETFRHYDDLIWQIPSWATAILVGVLVAVSRIMSVTWWPWRIPREGILVLILAGAFVFHTVAFYTLYRFRVHQATIKDVGGPFSRRPVCSAQFWLQFAVIMESAVLLCLALHTAGCCLWPFVMIGLLSSWVLTGFLEELVRHYNRAANPPPPEYQI